MSVLPNSQTVPLSDASANRQATHQLNLLVRFFSLTAIGALVLSLIAGCGSVQPSQHVSVDRAESFAVLPALNLSRTPTADRQLGEFLEINLRDAGVYRLEVIAVAQEQHNDIKVVLDGRRRVDNALDIARAKGYRYAFASTVHEWHYRNGVETEPTVGISLKLVDLKSEQVIWQAHSAKTGWGFSNLSTLGHSVLADLLKRIAWT